MVVVCDDVDIFTEREGEGAELSCSGSCSLIWGSGEIERADSGVGAGTDGSGSETFASEASTRLCDGTTIGFGVSTTDLFFGEEFDVFAFVLAFFSFFFRVVEICGAR